MMNFKVILVLFILFSSLVQADENAFDKAKSTAQQWWGETKQASSDVAQRASEKASVLGEKASENAKETGLVIWDKMKEVGVATQDNAKIGVSKIKSLLPEEECKEDSALCLIEKQ
ncbi:hypothetical protein [Marinomonas sp. IMCC 4694]|uniref:hypothetical protein n=1 Tax=Marinomonas sp. IMCC 4694 TaxID=2605432 RepID=UPI0011E8453B|nr:hypothetical protein [Marinomonas sp. IMCC 4694]TYL47851.1 hypothetical protein FXV75_07785 [Marinomonas sp. IMCC 4694]